MFPQERELLFDGDVFAAAEMVAVMEQKNFHGAWLSSSSGEGPTGMEALPGRRSSVLPAKSRACFTFQDPGGVKFTVRAGFRGSTRGRCLGLRGSRSRCFPGFFCQRTSTPQP